MRPAPVAPKVTPPPPAAIRPPAPAPPPAAAVSSIKLVYCNLCNGCRVNPLVAEACWILQTRTCRICLAKLELRMALTQMKVVEEMTGINAYVKSVNNSIVF